MRTRLSKLLLLAGVIVAITLLQRSNWFAGDGTGELGGADPPAAGEAPRATLEPTNLKRPEDAPDREPATPSAARIETPTTALSVAVFDGEGSAIEGARIEGQGPAASLLEPRAAPAQWGDIAVGAWTIEANADGYLPRIAKVRLEPGGTNNLRLTLVPREIISGRLHDRFGAPASWPIWFLSTDAKHPLSLSEGETRPSVRPDRQGIFTWTPPESGWYRLSVGPVGRVDGRMREPVYVDVDQPREVRVVLDSGTRLEVRVDGMVGSTRPAANRIVAVALERSAPSPARLEQAQRRKRRDEERRTRRRERATRPMTPDQQARFDDLERRRIGRDARAVEAEQNPRPEPWRRRLDAEVPADGLVIFERLPTTSEYRLALRIDGLEYASDQIFELDGKYVTVLHATLPPPLAPNFTGEEREAARQAARAAGLPVLSTTLERKPRDPAIPPPGFHWD